MLPLDYLHALCLAAVALYIWRREPARLLLTPLMLLSFLVLYGIGNIIYFLGADALPDVRRAVTLSLILMWAGLITGIELSSRSMDQILRRRCYTRYAHPVTRRRPTYNYNSRVVSRHR